MSVEIVNLVQAMLSFTAANPPVTISRDGVRSVTRTGTGTFEIVLDEPIPFDTSGTLSPGALITAKPQGPTFASGVAQADGSVLVTANAIGGAAADTGARIDVTVLRYPNKA